MPKATAETLQSDSRTARAILSAPYPLASIRARPYIIFRPVPPPSSTNLASVHPAAQQHIIFGPNAPFFYGSNIGRETTAPSRSNTGWTDGQGVMGWHLPIATPAFLPTPILQTDSQQAAAQHLSEALDSPMDISDAAEPAGQSQSPLRIAHEAGKISTPGRMGASKGPPRSLNLLTSAFQTILPRSLLDYRQMHDSLITPPVPTSSTTFYTGVTAGGCETVRWSPTTPVVPGRSVARRAIPTKGRKYGQRERESSGEDSDSDWSSDATITRRKYRSRISPRLETPSTPPWISHPPPARTEMLSRQIKGLGKAKASRLPPSPLFLGQTNLSPFTYDLSRRRHHSGSGSTMSTVGFHSDATSTTVIRVPRSYMKQREVVLGRGVGGLFWKAPEKREEATVDVKGKGRMSREEEQQMEMAMKRPLSPLLSSPGHAPLFTPHSRPVTDPIPRQQDVPSVAPALLSPERPYSPQPISIDPQSAHFAGSASSWLHIPQAFHPVVSHSMTFDGLPTVSVPLAAHLHGLPYTKACHNFLHMRHRQAARRRRLLLDYHRRVKAEEEAEGRMQVDTPVVASFAQSQYASTAAITRAGDTAQYTAEQPGYGVPPMIQRSSPADVRFGQPEVGTHCPRRHEVDIRTTATIARGNFDDGKPARKRRRDLSPESAYHPLPEMLHKSAPGYRSVQETCRSPPPLALHGPTQHLQLSPPSLSTHATTLNRTHHTLEPPLLPPVQIRTQHTTAIARPPPVHHDHHAQYSAPTQWPRRDGNAGFHGGYTFEQGRAEEIDRRLMEDMKVARRDAWLEEVGVARQSAGKGRSSRR